jgi:hypothetical protein
LTAGRTSAGSTSSPRLQIRWRYYSKPLLAIML